MHAHVHVHVTLASSTDSLLWLAVLTHFDLRVQRRYSEYSTVTVAYYVYFGCLLTVNCARSSATVSIVQSQRLLALLWLLCSSARVSTV